ncbi:hypothetical protein EC973_007596, partial [Apophysomyces ossiformis]
LKKYITKSKNPRFSAFVSKNKKDIPAWSLDIAATSSHGLHGAWVERFNDAYMKINSTKKRPQKSKHFNHKIWDEIYSSFTRRKQALEAFHEEAISTLTEAASPAGREVRRLFHPPDESLPTEPIAHHDHDEHIDDSTELPNDDTPSNATPVSSPLASTISSPSTPLSVSLLAPGQDRFFVDQADISEKFYQMQQCVFGLVGTSSLALESDVHLILSLSSILLLQNNNRIHKAMIPYFGHQLYTKIRKQNLDSWTTNAKFPAAAMVNLIEIAQDVYNKKKDICEAGASILTLASTMDNSIDKQLIMSIYQLVQFLPYDATNLEIWETTLITRYLVPALQPLFDHRERNVRLEFTATDLADKHKRPPSFNGSPDCIITTFPHATDDGVNIGFGEVKRSTIAGDHFLVNWDLVRLAMFGKGALDSNNLSANLAVHVIAPFVTFYLIKLEADGLYTMTELDRVQIPMSILEVPAYLSNFTRLKNVMHIFESFCTPEDNNIDTSWRRQSLLATDLMSILNKKKNRKRKNSTGHAAR